MSAPVRPWTPAEDRVLRERILRDGAPAVAAAIGRSLASIYHRASRLRIIRKRRWTPQDDHALRDHWSIARNLAEISRILGRTELTVYWRARRLGLTAAPPQGHEYLTTAAVRTGYSVESLRMILRWAGVCMRRALSRTGDAVGHRMHLVDSFDVDEAIERWHTTENVESAARDRGVLGDSLRSWLRAARAAGDRSIPAEPRKRKGRWRVPSVVIDRVIADRAAHYCTIKEVADRIGVSVHTISGWLLRAGVPREGRKWGRVDRRVVERVVAERLARKGCRARPVARATGADDRRAA